MEVKIFYGLFGSFLVVLILSTGVLYLVANPNPVMNIWSDVKRPFEALTQDDSIAPTDTALNSTNQENSQTSMPGNETIDTTDQVTTSLTASPSPIPSSSPTPTPDPSPTYELSQLYRFINAHRKENRLTKLSINLALERSARTKLIDMIDDGYWRHENTSGEPTWQFLENAGYQYSLAGENLAFNHNSAWKTFEGWMYSPEHNAQLLNKEYEDMGAAVDCLTIRDSNGYSCIVVLHLGKPK